jgi:hypothetical protein
MLLTNKGPKGEGRYPSPKVPPNKVLHTNRQHDSMHDTPRVEISVNTVELDEIGTQ